MLNENIKTIRNNKGFTQEELAARLHVTRQTISKWEKGYSVPDASNLSEVIRLRSQSYRKQKRAEPKNIAIPSGNRPFFSFCTFSPYKKKRNY